MTINKLAFAFQYLPKTRKKITITEDKVSTPYTSKILGVIFYIGFFFPIFAIPTFSEMYHVHLDRSLICGITMSYFIAFILFFNYFFSSNSVIDFKNNTFYYEVIILGIGFKLNRFSLDDILFVSNNVTTQLFNPGGRTGRYEGRIVEFNKKTQQFQNYYVSFLLKDGRLLNFLHLGIFDEDYNDSLMIAQRISDSCDLPLVVCKDDCTLRVKGNIVSNYYLSEENIEQGSVPKRLLVLGLLFILICTIMSAFMYFLFRRNKKNVGFRPNTNYQYNYKR